MSGGTMLWVRAVIAFGLLLELGVFLVLLGAWVRERAALLRFVRDAEHGQPNEERLPSALRTAADALIPTLKNPSAIDGGLSWALLAIGHAPSTPSPLLAFIIDSALAVIAALPLTLALAEAAQKLAGLPALTAEDARTYLAIVRDVPAAFSSLRAGFSGSGLLGIGLGAVVALRSALFGAASREARVREAFVLAVAKSRPDAKVTEARRTLESLIDKRAWAPPLAAAIAFLLSVGAGAAALHAGAPIRSGNLYNLSFARWPDKAVISSVIEPQRVAAGSRPVPGNSLLITKQQASFGGHPLVDLTEGQLPASWESQILPSPAAVGTASTLIMADGQVPTATLLALLHYLDRAHHLRDFGLIVERTPPGSSPAQRTAQASLDLALSDGNVPDVTLTVDAEQVKIGSESVSFMAKAWQHALRSSVRDLLRIDEAPPARLAIGLRLSPELPTARLLEVLGAADGVCETSEDCGMPGLGIHFVVLD